MEWWQEPRPPDASDIEAMSLLHWPEGYHAMAFTQKNQSSYPAVQRDPGCRYTVDEWRSMKLEAGQLTQ